MGVLEIVYIGMLKSSTNANQAWILLVGAISLGLLLSSCVSCRAPETKSLRLVWFGSEEEEQAIRDALAAFEQEYPGYRVELQPIEWAKYNEKVMTMLLGRRPPDLARMSVQWCSRYRELGAFADIAPWLDANDLKDFDPSRLESCRQGEAIFGLPQTSVGLMLFYNRDLFDQAGVAAPESPDSAWSWEEFSQAAQDLQKRTGVRFGWGAFRGWFPFLTFLYENNGSLLRSGEPDFANAANVEALQWFVQQHETGIAPKSSWSHGGDAAESVFLRGDSAMVITGNWRLATFDRQIQNFEWDVTYLPRRKRRATNLGGENLMVFKTPRAESAALLARFLTRPDRMEDFCSRTMFLPTRESLLEAEVPYRLRPEAMKKFAIQAADFEPAWAAEQSTAQFAMIENSFLKQIELAVLGFQSAQASLEILNEEYRNALEE